MKLYATTVDFGDLVMGTRICILLQTLLLLLYFTNKMDISKALI